MIREFGNANVPTTVNVTEIRPQPENISILMREDVIREEPALRSFHRTEEQNESDNNIAKMVGGVVVGLLIVGGGIYAYESTSATKPVQQKIAMNKVAPTPVAAAQPANPPAVAPPATATDTTAAPFQTSPDGLSPTPSRTANSANGTSSPSPTPAADDAINAPMTLTPDNAPAPQQAAPAGQTALQQPMTAPNVSVQSGQATPEVANNAAAGINLPSETPQTVTPSEPVPTPAPMEQTQPALPAQ